MAFTTAQIETILKKMLDHAYLEGGNDCDKMSEYEEFVKELGDIVVAEIKKHNVALESKNIEPIGRAWIPKGTHSDIAPLFECQCVRDGKVVLVEANHPDALLEENDHRNGEWCPCPGMDKKWIYLNEPSTSDPECCGKQICSGECSGERRNECEFEEVEEGHPMDVSDEEYITNATRTPQIDVDGYVEEYFPKTVEEYNKYIGELEDQYWWVWWKNECK
jgi:hypothetical protein